MTMTYIKEKISYLKGFSDALKLGENSDEGKALLKVFDILDDITDALDGLAKAQSEMTDHIELMDENLGDLEEYVFFDDEDLDFDDLDDFDEDVYEVTCPKCGEKYYSDFESFEADAVQCPICGEDFVLEEAVVEKLTSDFEDECCACCHHDDDDGK